MNKNLFGTDGIRAKVGEFPLDIDSLTTLGYAIGLWTKKNYGIENPIIMGNDTRESCCFVKSALKAGLELNGLNILDIGMIPTPGVFQCIKQAKVHLGIVISASHNPYMYNGIKIFNAEGKISQKDEQAISDFFFQKNKKDASYDELGIDTVQEEVGEFSYCDGVQKKLEVDPSTLHKKTIILDLAHGATALVAQQIFEDFENASVIYLCDDPDGTNINENCGSTHPENLQKEVLKHKADIGFAFDGDGDRVVVVNKNGEIKNGDDILALLATHPNYKNEKAVVGTIMTNCGLEDFLKQKNKKLIRTPVGDKHIAKALTENNLSLGAEPSGHVICADYLNTGDGIFAALRVLETAALTNNWDLKTFAKYPQKNVSIPVSEKKDLSSDPLAKIINDAQAQLESGQIVVRYSGTEPILRVMVEDKRESVVNAVCDKLVRDLKKELG